MSDVEHWLLKTLNLCARKKSKFEISSTANLLNRSAVDTSTTSNRRLESRIHRSHARSARVKAI